VGLFWVHLPDGVTPVAAITGRQHGPGTSLVGIQDEYSLAHRAADTELIPAAEAFGLGACLYAPLAGGLLTAKYRAPETGGRLAAWGAGVRTEDTAQHTAALDTMTAVAKDLDSSPARVAVAWLAERAQRFRRFPVPVV
jgi:aryl-alcohol dehydrogenase-like predicted oxidoreductase